MSNNLVAYSRAGDVFHYRWAARRCLRLIYPNSLVRKIYIEGSAEIEKAGEYVIDVTEYSIGNDGNKKIDYYQLKHTTVKIDDPFTLSDLADTLKGFAARFLQHKDESDTAVSDIFFTVITNRKIADSFKNNLSAIINNKKVNSIFENTIKKYTNLATDDLASFCSLIHLEDGEGNYNIQKNELRIELAQLIAGSIDNAQIENLISLVQEKVLPDSDGSINREEVLKRFGITTDRELYPASAVWEKLENIIERKQQEILKKRICDSLNSVIIHAAGGVGKSFFCRQLIGSLSEGSLGIAYDCFGAGSYRNRSETRHRHRDALVQIINELAAKGLCDPLIVQNTTLDEDIMRKFLLRLETSVKSLKRATDSAQLFILIDAADNAEMAAREYNQSCFAHELLRERIPEGCKLVLLCRTERIHLLQPQSHVYTFELEPFSETETLENLRIWFPEANQKDGVEFYRLTSGNPRVQANALAARYNSVIELLSSLGPFGISVEKQIELQLQAAISKVKDLLPAEHYNQINSICLGLASLPPHIPIGVLAEVAKVSVEHIKSFVSDIGRSLWISDTSIQFRDEPTETWFRDTFLATRNDYENYINILEPSAHQLSYVAEVLPQFYLHSGQYDKLINIALSDHYLPINNPIDARNIRVYRLQFAFKAALKLRNQKDAVKLAMRAGEEVAGNLRQLSLFQSNIDLLTTLQSKERIQEIAFKRLLSGRWDGSENVYTASLLSGVSDYHGEARGYLRAAINWLIIHFDERAKRKSYNHDNDISDSDILELAYAHLNIFGVEESVHFLKRFTSKVWVFNIVKDLTKRLVDIGAFEAINEFLQKCKDEVYFTVAVTSELVRVGRFPAKSILEPCLDLLCSGRSRILKPNSSYKDRIIPSLVSFAEACLYHELLPQKISRIIRHYIPEKASRMVYDSHSSDDRTIFLKALAIRTFLSGKNEVEIEEIYPTEFTTKESNYELNNDVRVLTEVINGLFPWYLLRIQVLNNKNIKLLEVIGPIDDSSKKARANRYRNYDTLPNEIAEVCASILVLYHQGTIEEIINIYESFLQNNKAFRIQDKLNTLRAAHRSTHLVGVRQPLELSTYDLIKSNRESGPEEIANEYIALARAVLITSPDDASVYFDEAINISSKFGDEIVQRWEAVVSLAKRSCDNYTVSNELAYRFIRCAELVGENVYREKHWNRSEAMRVCTRMSPGIGISALSRWRDRDIGHFEYQLEAVLKELVTSKVVEPSIGWVLNRFFSNHHLNEFLSLCLDNESSSGNQQTILDDAVYLLQIEGANKDYWLKLKGIATKYNINNDALHAIAEFYAKENQSVDAKNIGVPDTRLNDKAAENIWDDIFEGIAIATTDGFRTLVDRLKSKEEEGDFSWRIRGLLREAIDRLEEKSFWEFIEVIILSDAVNYYDIQDILSWLPQEWKSKISFKAKLPNLIYRIGERYAHELTDGYIFNSFVSKLNLDKTITELLITGILSGLANGDEFADANIFFGFIKLVSSAIETQEAGNLVDYSLSRFELHLEDDFGDGDWSNRLQVLDDVNHNVAGFIWSALGAPRSKVRWNAAHCIKKLADFNCVKLLDALVNWLKYDEVDAFGHYKFPFYNLHARQYLLIAFARVSVENSELLRNHHNLFLNYALCEPHVLIQKFAVDIVLNIENAFPGTYDEDTLTSIKNVGKSGFPIQEEEYHYLAESFWHKEGKLDTSVKFDFGWDFDRYWYEPLGEIFGVSGKQIEDLAANLIVTEWRLGDKNDYNKDPRVILWNHSSNERETWHDHGSYPRADNLDFYLSYHAMHVIAARLIEKMPVIKKRDCYDDPWLNWLSRHLLTRQDGKWVADNRSALPLKRPLWISEEKKDTWQTETTEEDFLKCLKTEENGNLWIGVKGGWHKKDNVHKESFSISTALVSTKTSEALLRALATCSNPYDYKLPSFDEEDMEIESGIFQLKGWINDRFNSKRLDEYDPYADEIDYPPYSLGSSFIESLGLVVGNNRKTWQLINSSETVLTCETWSSHREGRDEEPAQSGMRLKASLSFLKQLCATLECDVIFDVSINREISNRYDRNKREYVNPQHKVFILSADGKLRTTSTDYKLG